MGDLALRVDGLGKQYRIGKREAAYRTFRDALADAFSAPFRRVAGLLRGNAAAAADLSETIWALRDVSFEVKKGEVVGIIGRNGAGKSTLLKILASITEPSEGEVQLYGRVGALLEVGTGFHFELTGRENIYLNGAILGMSRAEIKRKFDEIVAFAEVEKFIDTPIKHYSSGMVLRLGFAVAAHLEPEILIVDEVLAVGDAAFQRKCLGKMNEVAGEGRTVLFVSHDMAAVRKLCTRAVLFEQGKQVLFGEVDEVIDSYLKAQSNASSVIELPAGDPESPAYGTRIEFRDSAGQLRSEFRIGEQWQVVLHFNVRRAVKHLIAAVGLMLLDSLPLATYWSLPQDLTAGQYSATFQIDFPFKNVYLQFAVGISVLERPVYYCAGIGQVRILDVAKDEQPFRSTGGILNTPQTTRIREVSYALDG
ncbi:MAG: ATP-binding cassette domain-containing protein [Chloroflexi bacterium]|nr:ATP-binding cassette domain-containing protein [Chloroflexota bacterium]